MSKIKQVLRLHKDGVSNREIARQLDLYKGTVNKYVNLAKADSKSLDELLCLDEPELEHRFCGGNPAYTDKRFDDLSTRLAYIVSELGRKHTTMYLLWEEYRECNPEGYSYTQFCYHVKQYIEASGDTKVSLPLSPFREGGKELFVDFSGDKLPCIDPDTGEEVMSEVFVASLPASDFGFAMAVGSQRTEDFIYAMECCFRALGGVPSIIVTDNLKAAVIKADRYEPDINQVMLDFTNHYGCVHIPARAHSPKDKALVEDHVQIIYHRVFATLRNMTFFSREEQNRAIAEKMRLHNQKRMQRMPYTREERFLSIDKPNLKPLPATPFEIKYRTRLTVLPNSHVYMGRDRAYYSVPFRLVGQKANVIYTRVLVTIYDKDGLRVAVHPRATKQGQYVTLPEHMPSYYENYVNLSPQKYIRRAAAISQTFASVIDGVFKRNTDVPPETFYKSCDGLFHLQSVTEPALFERACAAALEFDRCQYSFIKNLVESKCAGISSREDEPVLFPEMHDNIRGKEYYL